MNNMHNTNNNTHIEKYIKNCIKKYTETDKEDENEEKVIISDNLRDKMIKSIHGYNNIYISDIVNKIAYIFILNDISNLNYVRFVFENVNNKNKFFNIQVYFTDSKLIETYEVEHNLFVYAFSRKFIGCFNKEITKEILKTLARTVLYFENEDYVVI